MHQRIGGVRRDPGVLRLGEVTLALGGIALSAA
jgi:hypothetical protein